MRWLLFLSRLAFICNIFFLLAFSIQISDWVRDEDITDYFITIGFVMAFIINPATNLCYLFTGMIARNKLAIIPRWLIVANVLFLIIDAFYLLFINAHK